MYCLFSVFIIERERERERERKDTSEEKKLLYKVHITVLYVCISTRRGCVVCFTILLLQLSSVRVKLNKSAETKIEAFLSHCCYCRQKQNKPEDFLFYFFVRLFFFLLSRLSTVDDRLLTTQQPYF
jgi:hypothetical protein